MVRFAVRFPKPSKKTFGSLAPMHFDQALALVDGTDLNLDSLNAPFVLRLRQSGPKLLCHPGGLASLKLDWSNESLQHSLQRRPWFG